MNKQGIIYISNNTIRKELLINDYYKFTYKDSKIGMSERNKEIVRKYMSGKPCKALSKEYNVSYNRIRKIIMEFIKRVRWVRKGIKTYEY